VNSGLRLTLNKLDVSKSKEDSEITKPSPSPTHAPTIKTVLSADAQVSLYIMMILIIGLATNGSSHG
jgi:hypothetical protein